MKITQRKIYSGRAGGKVCNEVEGYGSFQTIYYEPFVGCMHTAYICHSIKHPAEDKLCDCLLEVARHFECDIDELCNSLPKGYSEERFQ